MHKVELHRYDNKSYQLQNRKSVLLRVVWYLVNILCFINPIWVFNDSKISLLRLFGAKVGNGVVIKPGVNIKYPWLLSIGDHTWIGERVWIDSLSKVTIGSNVCVSQGSMLLTGNHDYTSKTFDLKLGEIILEDGVWIGAQALVCPGVTAHSHAVLAAGSVATRSLEAYMIHQGNPARPTRQRVIKD
jgi:putative colanic acid biosynthesis acetyltransferase WcaF